MTELARIVRFLRAFDERLVERIVPTPHGRMLLTPSLPRVYYLNYLSVDPGATATAVELAAEAGEAPGAGGLAHRKVAVDDGTLGAALEPGFRALGWTVERLLVMAHRGAEPEIDTSAVVEVEPDELEPVWTEGIRSSPEIEDGDGVRQLVAAQHRRRRAAHIRYFAARVDGRIAAYCELFSDGETAQVESVMTLEPFRGRGLGKAVVARALREAQAAGHDLVFLLADADDWPKELYGKLGFVEVGTIRDFLRKPA
jgi:ribosomal protein S18 acetylase RimI-like enzyme